MPRFFFDCHDSDLITIDATGVECRSLVEAELLAIRAAADMASDFSPGLDLQRINIEIKDQQRRQVATITVSLSIGRTATSVVLREGVSSNASSIDELG